MIYLQICVSAFRDLNVNEIVSLQTKRAEFSHLNDEMTNLCGNQALPDRFL